MTDSPFFAIIIVPIVLILFWVSVVRFASVLSGWQKLAASYKVENRLTDGVLKWKSGYLRYFTRYNNVLHIKGTEEGLYLATALLLRPGHAPLLIPWDRFMRAEVSKLLFTFIKLDVAISPSTNEDVIKMSFYGRGVGDNLLPFLEEHGLLSAESPPLT